MNSPMIDIMDILEPMSITSIAIFFPVDVIRNSGPMCVRVIVFPTVTTTLKGRECTHSPWWLLRERSFQ